MGTDKPIVLITGCSQGGIGDALAQEFSSRGYRVFAAVRDVSKAAQYPTDKDIEIVLVNNAGTGATGPLLDAEIDTAKSLYDVNVFGLLAVTQAFAPALIEARGKVVNMSSVGGLLGLPWGGT